MPSHMARPGLTPSLLLDTALSYLPSAINDTLAASSNIPSTTFFFPLGSAVKQKAHTRIQHLDHPLTRDLCLQAGGAGRHQG